MNENDKRYAIRYAVMHSVYGFSSVQQAKKRSRNSGSKES